MTNRLHVLGDGQQTCVIVTDEPSVTAAVKRQLLAVAEQAGLIDPHLVSTSPIQSPHSLKQIGLAPWQPLVYVAGSTAADTTQDLDRLLADDQWYAVRCEVDGSRTVDYHLGSCRDPQSPTRQLQLAQLDARVGLMRGVAIKHLRRNLVHISRPQ